MNPLAPHMAAFLRERLPCSQHTIDTYAHSFRLLFGFAADRLGISPSQLAIEHIDAVLVLAFLEHVETVRKNSPRTRNVRLAAIRSFMRFVEYRIPSALDQVRCILAIPMKKVDVPQVVSLTFAEMQAVLDAPDPHVRSGIRDRAMLYIAFSAGLRVSELVGLLRDSVSFEPRLAIKVLGKGRRERVLPLWKEAATALRAWLAVRGTAAAPEVFINVRGEAMTRSGFEYILDCHVKSAVLKCPSLRTKSVSPHVLRHTCAMLILQATGDIRKVALWLGHASVQTTEIYVSADPTWKLEVAESVVPPMLRRGNFRPPDQLIASLRGRVD